VLQMVQKVFDEHEIVLGPWGDLSFGRDFDGQLNGISPGSSQAQPGESNHNFGRAMDIGFKGLRWIGDDFIIRTVTGEHNFDTTLLGWRAEALFKARNLILEKPPVGTGPFFRIRWSGKDEDPNHFQAVNQLDMYPDPHVSMSQSLVGLLDTVGPLFPIAELTKLGLRVLGPMTWKWGGGHRYNCDLGFGGDKFVVGEAKDIFLGRAAVTQDMLAQATNAMHAAMGGGVPQVHAADFKQPQVDAMKNALQAIFFLADDHWRDWAALDGSGHPI
jgi:hypothetical protein